MSVAPWTQQLRLAVYAGTLGLAALVACAGSPTWAQEADEADDLENHILNTDKRLMERFLGTLGLVSTSPGIDYRERSPLVVPPARDLPPPGKAAKKVDWPLDPEVKAKRDAAAARKAGRAPADIDPAKAISGTAEGYRTGNAGKWDESNKGPKEPEFFKMLMSGSLSGKKEEVGTFTGEPERSSLVDPPPGYLTPSPAAPYGVTKRAGEAEKKEPKL